MHSKQEQAPHEGLFIKYQGQENDRRMRSSFQDLVEMPSDACKVYIPGFSFAFFNVRGLDEKKVQEKILLKFYVEIIKMQNDSRIKEVPPRLVRGLLKSMEQRTAQKYIEIFCRGKGITLSEPVSGQR